MGNIKNLIKMNKMINPLQKASITVFLECILLIKTSIITIKKEKSNLKIFPVNYGKFLIKKNIYSSEAKSLCQLI